MSKIVLACTSFLFFAFSSVPSLAQIPTSGLRLHLKADAGTSTTTSGETVSTLTDPSGNNSQDFQDNAALQSPYIVESSISMGRFNPTSPTSMDLPMPSEMEFNTSESETHIEAKTSSSAPNITITGALEGEIQFSSVGSNEMTLTFPSGGGLTQLVFVKSGSAVSLVPQNNYAYPVYPGNEAFGTGNDYGGGNYAVYNGTGNSVTVTNLSPSTVYHFAVYQYYSNPPYNTYPYSPYIASNVTSPSTSASNVQFSSIGVSDMTVSFTPGNGSKRIVLARESAAVSVAPTNGQSYSASTTFGSGSDLGSGNYVVYNGTGNSVTLSGLSNSTTYHFSVYEFSEYSGETSYLTTSPAISSSSTIVVPYPVISAETFGKGTSTSRKITGLINPSGYETTVEVIYGTSSGNLSSTTSSHSIGSGAVNVADTISVTGLTAGQAYYAKIRATNIRGSVESSVVTLVPLTLTSLQGWYRGDILKVYPSTTTIKSWTDISGSGHDLYKTSNNTAQILSGINGTPSASFTSSAFRFLPSELGIQNTDLEMFIVFKSSSNTTQDLLYKEYSGGLIQLNKTNVGIKVNPSYGYQTEVTSGSLNNYTNGNAYVMHYKSANNRHQVRVNNENLSYKSGNNRLTSNDEISLGGSFGNGPFNGQIAEVLFFSSALPFEQRQEIAQYLSDRYAISMYIPTVPETAASDIAFSNIEATHFDVSFTAGSGERRIVVARLNGSAKTAPTSNTIYTANTAFGSGSNLGNGNYVVYDGTGNAVSITGLTQSSEYTIDVYEYNYMDLEPQYMSSSPNSASQTTQSVTPPVVQLDALSGMSKTSVTIKSLINPNGFSTDLHISYGTTSGVLSSSTTIQAVGSQSSSQSMNTALTGLTTGTKYFYKISATNIGGTTESAENVFYTGYEVNHTDVSLPSLAYWLAGDGATYTSGTGQPVRRWANQAGNSYGLNAYQNLEASLPQFVTESEISFVRFDGANDYLELAPSDSLGITNSNYEVFIVAKSSSEEADFLMGGALGNFEVRTRTASGEGIRFIPNSGVALDRTATFSNGSFHIINAKATSTQALVRVDGNTNYINQDARSSVSSDLLIATPRNGTSFFTGDIAEVIIYNSDLTESESQKISQYLATKYSITLTPFTVPTVKASALVFSNYVDGGVTASVTAGNGTNRLFVIRASGTAAVAPTNGLLYTANANYGTGATTGTGNYVVSASSATSVSITGLTTNSEYVVEVYEFNQAGSDPRYVTNAPASGSMQALDFSIYEGKIAYVVTSSSDANTGSGKNGTLRYVMNAINTHASDSTSLIDMRLVTGTIMLTNELPAINYNIILVGSGTENLTISGNNLYRPFFIGAGTAPFTAENPATPTITLKDFSIANGLGKGGNGYAGSGGAAGMGGALFVNAGNVTLENLNFASNKVQGGSGESGVYGSGGGGGFAGNGGSSVAGSSGYLGGIVPNTAGASGGPGAGGFGDAYIVGNGGFGAGGASASTLYSNGITSHGGNGGFGGGGGAHGSIQAGIYTVVNGTGGFGAGSGIVFSGTDMRGGGGAGMGGAVFNRNGDVIIKNSSFTSNTAEYGLGGGEGYRSNGSSYGGAIFNYDGTILTTGVTFGSGGGANSAVNTTDYYNYNTSGSVVTLSSATNILASSFTANAEITTFGRSGSYHVAYGTDNSSFLGTTNSVNFTGQSSALIVAIPVSGLNLSNDFYYKIVVTNEFGTYESSVGSLIFEPTTTSSSPLITSISASTINGTLTKGNGTKRLILAKKGSAVDAQPVDGQTYSTSSAFGSGAEIGTGNFVVYNATESTFAITGLEAGKEYHFKVFEYNGTTLTEYLTSSTLSFSENTISSIPAIVKGSSLKFKGNDGQVLIPLHASLQNTSAISLEAWIKPSVNTAYAQIVGNIWDDGLTESGYGLTLNGATGLFFAVETSGNAGAQMEYLSGDGITLNEWNHVAATYDGTTKRIYINGKEVASSALNTGTITYSPANNVRIGRFVDGDEVYAFTGEIDEVRIWKTVRTNKEIREHMFTSVQSDYQDLISYWQFNEGTGTSVLDLISGNNGTLSNFEFNSTSGWFDSAIPFGTGTFTEFENVTNGTHNGSNVSIAMSEAFDNAVTLVTNYFTVAPNVLLTGATTKIEDAYWVIAANGVPGTFSASLSFTVPTSLTTGGVSANSQFKLYRRNLGSSGAWELVSSSATSYSSNTVVFDGITQLGQFTISRTFDIEFDHFAGKSILFDGINDYVTTPNNNIFNVSKYTMELWFKWNKAGKDIEFLTGKYYSEFEIHTNGTNNSIRFIPAPQVYIDSPSNAFELNTWTHLTVVYDPSQSLAKMYFNGIEVAITNNGSSSLSRSIENSTNPISFGTRTGGEYFYTGELDEIRIWNTVRTPAEILEDMSNTSPSEYNSALVGYWQFNEGTGNSTKESANGLTGTLTNFDHNASSGWKNSLIPITQTKAFEITLTGTQGWRLLASPISADSYSPLLSSIWTQGFTGANYASGSSNIYTWPKNSAGRDSVDWTPLSTMETALSAGSGMLAYVFSDDNGPGVGGDAGFPKTISISGTEVIEEKNLASLLNTNTNGWTLLGNPFSNDIDWDLISKSGLSNSVYVWDNAASSWKTWNGMLGSLTDGKIGAFNGFFVETTAGSPTFSIPTNARIDGNGFLGKETSTELAAFSLLIQHENGLKNEAWFMFSENGTLGKDATDSYKLAPLSNEFVQISSLVQSENQGKVELDINSLPSEFTQVNIPLMIRSSDFGDVELSMDSNSLPLGWNARLWDSELDAYYSFDNEILVNLESVSAQTSVASTVSSSVTEEKLTSESGKKLSDIKSTGVKKRETKRKSASNKANTQPEIQSAGYENARFVLQVANGSIKDMDSIELPKTIELSQNYPNPFNPSTTIKFALPESGSVRLDLYDVTGRLVKTILNENKQAGFHQVNLDASALSSGMYFYRISTTQGQITKKMLLVK